VLTFPTIGLAMYESSTGKAVAAATQNNGAGADWAVQARASLSAFTGNEIIASAGVPPTWFEVERAGSTLYFRLSYDGENWQEYSQALTARFTTGPTHVGLYIVSPATANVANVFLGKLGGLVTYWDDPDFPAATHTVTANGGGSSGTATMSPVYKGARVTKTASQAIASGTWTPLTWESVSRDTSSFFNAATPTRYTVPSGVTKIRLKGSYWTHDGSAANFGCRFFKNGGDLEGSASNQANGGNWAFRSVASDVIDVVTGDYFEFVAFCTAATTIFGAPDTWFAIEVVEGSILAQTVGVALAPPYTPFKVADTGGLTTWTPGTATVTDGSDGMGVKAAMAASATLSGEKSVTPGNTSGVAVVDMRQAVSTGGGILLHALDSVGNVGYMFGVTYSGSLQTLALALYTCTGAGVFAASISEAKTGFYPAGLGFRIRDDGTTIFFDLSYDDGQTWQNWTSQLRSARMTNGVRSYKLLLTAPAVPALAIIKQLKAA
jgi:hypothetical protein